LSLLHGARFLVEHAQSSHVCTPFVLFYRERHAVVEEHCAILDEGIVLETVVFGSIFD
jgi:hypothetical protein